MVGVNKTDEQQKVEDLFGEIDWDSPSKGLMPCPGNDKHTKPDGHKDCQVRIDGVPTIHCFHEATRRGLTTHRKRCR